MKRASLFAGIVATIAACVLFAGCGGGSNGGSNSTATDGGSTSSTGSTVSVNMTGNHSFDPVNATVSPGDTVRWTNTDTTHHTVDSDTNQSGLNSQGQFPAGLPGGATFSWHVPTNATSGTVFYYHCDFHGTPGDGTHIGGGMAGSVTVR